MNRNLEHAIKYQKLGWFIIPVDAVEKKPLIKWKNREDKRPSEDELQVWFTKWPSARIGMLTGAKSGVDVLDIDSFEAMERLDAELGCIPPTITQTTGRVGGGGHFLFKHNGHGLLNQAQDNIDFKTTGGFVLLPPSIHASGKEYTWDNIDPTEHGLDDLLDMPKELADFLEKRQKSNGKDKTPLTLEPVASGKRHDKLVRLVGKWLSQGMDDETIYLTASGWYCSLPDKTGFPEEELREQIADLINRYREPNRPSAPIPGDFWEPENPTDSRPEFTFTHIGDVIKNVKPIEWRVNGILMEKCFSFSFGDSGTYKTFKMLDMGLCIAAGIPYHGHPVKQGTVFYICGEGQQGIGRRVAAWGIYNDIKVSDLPFFVSNTPTQLMDKNHIDDVARVVDRLAKQHGPPAYLGIDTLARNMGNGDESKTSDMITVVANMDAAFGNTLCRDLNHHTGHANKGRERGSIVLQQAVDSRFWVSLTAAGHVLVRTLKQKDFFRGDSMLFYVERIPLRIGDQDDESCALKLIAEGDDAEKEAESNSFKVSDQMTAAVNELNKMYDEYEANLGPGRIPHVEIKHWRKECIDKKIYGRTDNFNKAMNRLKDRKLIFFDENSHFVYSDLKYRKYIGNE